MEIPQNVAVVLVAQLRLRFDRGAHPGAVHYFAGALVLLPMAAQALRFVRKQRVA